MTTSFHARQIKRTWAINNPDKVRESNRRWRAGRESRLRQQARERMRRWRAKNKKERSSPRRARILT